ncbi:MAG: rod-binding protein [Candidatus Hydrogenedentota bacterium]
MLYINPIEVTQTARADRAVGSTRREDTALEEYEHYFLYTLLKEMRKSVPDSRLFDGHGDSVYRDMLDDKLAGVMAESGQLGIADDIRAQLRVAEAAKKRGTIAPPENGIALAKARGGYAAHNEWMELGSVHPQHSSCPHGLPINQAGETTPAGDLL